MVAYKCIHSGFSLRIFLTFHLYHHWMSHENTKKNTLGLDMCRFMKMNPLSVGWLMCWLLVLVDVIPTGDLLATILSALSFLFTHDISSQLTQLSSMTF